MSFTAEGIGDEVMQLACSVFLVGARDLNFGMKVRIVMYQKPKFRTTNKLTIHFIRGPVMAGCGLTWRIW